MLMPGRWAIDKPLLSKENVFEIVVCRVLSASTERFWLLTSPGLQENPRLAWPISQQAALPVKLGMPTSLPTLVPTIEHRWSGISLGPRNIRMRWLLAGPPIHQFTSVRVAPLHLKDSALARDEVGLLPLGEMGLRDDVRRRDRSPPAWLRPRR